MMGMSVGFTIGGKIPFAGIFANFATGRVYDQICQSIAYSGRNLKICASHSGVTLGEDGGNPPDFGRHWPYENVIGNDGH